MSSSTWAQRRQPKQVVVRPWLVVGVRRRKTTWAASLDEVAHATERADRTKWSGPEQGWAGGKATLWRSGPNSSVRTSQIARFALCKGAVWRRFTPFQGQIGESQLGAPSWLFRRWWGSSEEGGPMRWSRWGEGHRKKKKRRKTTDNSWREKDLKMEIKI